MLNKLLKDVLFRPFSVQVENFKIFVFSIGISNDDNWHGAGNGYMSSFRHFYKKKDVCLYRK